MYKNYIHGYLIWSVVEIIPMVAVLLIIYGNTNNIIV